MTTKPYFSSSLFFGCALGYPTFDALLTHFLPLSFSIKDDLIKDLPIITNRIISLTHNTAVSGMCCYLLAFESPKEGQCLKKTPISLLHSVLSAELGYLLQDTYKVLVGFGKGGGEKEGKEDREEKKKDKTILISNTS
jgi:hypothetical protein